MTTPTTTTSIAKPGFVSTRLTTPYWRAAEAGKLLLQECLECGHLQHYPRNLCTKCWSQDLQWKEAAGDASIWSFTVVGIPGHPAWGDEIPYILALVELVEGPRLMTNIVGCAPESVHCGQRVQLRPHRGARDNQTLLQFTPFTRDN
ncbi:hypothetical protein GCM10009715_32970 [Paeniglutamicibacter psychrophenolicus]|uniref:OB-fold protein n=1 Tax=Paeniglutamicibacter psychrophenolicus TaxID=257454 RepID=A0ABS4W9K8_9MICC|nr:OB-fold domain-containing protein [Paeniglutamicibacter psychrophenolicus]MBP2372886.1 putative OB-fold protein [Paeniglutamicibacter psychrophenolicus]